MKVTYIDHMGNDLRVVNAARVSFNKESGWNNKVFEIEEEAISSGENIDYDYVYSDRWLGGYPVTFLSDKDKKLLEYLAKNNHWTPFSHVMITMREKVPLFVARQRFKHQIGFTYNEVSRRYVDDEPEFYIPDAWRKRPEDGIKQGSSDEIIPKEKLFDYQDLSEETWKEDDLFQHALNLYNWLLMNDVAPEQARMVLPQSMYTEYYTTGSLAAWARAYKLRIDSHAQKEIQELAVMWDDIISNIKGLEHSWKTLKE